MIVWRKRMENNLEIDCVRAQQEGEFPMVVVRVVNVDREVQIAGEGTLGKPHHARSQALREIHRGMNQSYMMMVLLFEGTRQCTEMWGILQFVF
jgi:ribosomal protein S12 methylthiotransferase accessory factor YcaO